MLNNKRRHTLEILTEHKALTDIWHSIKKDNHIGESRVRNNVRHRHSAMVAMRKHGNLSLNQIANIFGKNHATVIHAIKNHAKDMLYDTHYINVYRAVENLIVETLDEFHLRDVQYIPIHSEEMELQNIITEQKSTIYKMERELATVKRQLEEKVKLQDKLIAQHNEMADKYHKLNHQYLVKTGMI